MYIYIYIILYIYIYIAAGPEKFFTDFSALAISMEEVLGWHYLSNATRLIRTHLFCALFIVSRITILCNIIRHLKKTCVRQVVLDKWFSLNVRIIKQLIVILVVIILIMQVFAK